MSDPTDDNTASMARERAGWLHNALRVRGFMVTTRYGGPILMDHTKTYLTVSW